MSGAGQPASSMRCLISGTARAASGVLTVTRTISDPASASSTHCRAVAAASAVSVIVMLWTTMGAPPPTCTPPTRTPIVLDSRTGDAIGTIILMSDSAGAVAPAFFDDARPAGGQARQNRTEGQFDMRTIQAAIAVTVLVFVWGAVTRAQVAVTTSDITRLETTAADLDKQIKAVEPSDPKFAADARKSLSDLRDEIAYLRVKLRRDGAVTQAEYTDVRDRLETLRVKTMGQPQVSAQPVLAPEAAERPFTVAVGTQLDVRLQTPLTSRTAKVEERFEATTVLDFAQGKDVVIPAGSVVRGFVSSVRPAGKIDRTGSLTLSFDELVIERRVAKLRASVVKALDPKVSDDVQRIGAGAVVGAVIGGILGGGKGALVGVLIGGGGTIASTEGSDVDLAVGTVLRIRVDQPIEVWR